MKLPPAVHTELQPADALEAKLRHIEEVCHEIVKLDAIATPRPWEAQEFCDPQWTINAPGQKPYIVAQSVGGNDEANATFIALARTIAPDAAKVTLTAIADYRDDLKSIFVHLKLRAASRLSELASHFENV